MNLRPKTKLRLLTLLGAGVVLAALGTVGVVFQLHRYESHRLALRASAMAAFQHADYSTAAEYFGKYLGNDRIDPEAIFDYAVARGKVPRADLSHLTQARALLLRYLELKPGDVEAQHQLLDIYQQLRYGAESTALADQLLAGNADDIPALQARLSQLIRDRQFNTALPVSMHLNQLQPDDLQGQETTYEMMARLHRPAVDFTSRADAMLATHPADPRFELLRASAVFWTGDSSGAIKWLRLAAMRTPPSGDFVLMLAGAFDKMGMWSDSADLLAKNAVAQTASATLKACLAQRLFEMGQYDRALSVLTELKLDDPATDSNLIGLYALLQHASNQGGDFKPALAALSKRSNDPVAAAWVSLMQAIGFDAAQDAPRALRLCRTARQSDPHNPDVHFYLGTEYFRMGEDELALQSLQQAAKMQPEWETPYRLMTGIFQQRGQISDALQMAESALKRDPQSLAAQTDYVLLCCRHLASNAAGEDVRALLDQVRKLRTAAPEDAQLLAAEINLLIRSDQKSDAAALATEALVTRSPAILKQLAISNEANHFGLEKQIADRLSSCEADTPELALDQVEADMIAGRKDAAKSVLPAMRTRVSTDWKLAWLQAREATGDPAVATDWGQFSDSLPADPQVQIATLHSSAAWSDRPLMDRTIDRFKALTGEDGIEWKLSRARWELGDGFSASRLMIAPGLRHSEETGENSNESGSSGYFRTGVPSSGASQQSKTAACAEAAELMAEVSRAAPRYAAPQEIWAEALITLGDTAHAIEHLRLAMGFNPDNTEYPLELAKLLIAQGRLEEATSLLNTAQAGEIDGDAQRIQIALLDQQIGDQPGAIKMLADGRTIHPDDPARDVLMAQLYAQTGDTTDAQRIYSELMVQKLPDARAITAAASFMAAEQMPLPQCREILKKLDTLTLPAGEKKLAVGEFEARWGDRQLAATAFANAAKAAPTAPEVWIAWAGMDLRDREFSGAFEVAANGLKNAPADSELAAMKDLAQTLAGLKLDADAQGVLDALAVDPTNEPASAVVKAISTSETSSDLTEKLVSIADQYPRFLPVQTVLIERDLKAGNCDRAETVATRANQMMPAEIEPARLLAETYAAAGRWDLALSAARQWRQRSLNHPHAADVAIATAQLALHRPEMAESQLDWCVNAATDQDADALEIYARAVCAQGRFTDAWNTLVPLLEKSGAWRHRWLRIVTSTAPDLVTAARRIHQTEPLTAADLIEDQLGLGEAWYTVATKFNDVPSLAKANSVIEPLTDAGSAPADAWLLMGAIQQRQNDPPAAEQSFNTAVKLAPDLAAARNDLAMIMLLRNEDPGAARQQATAAVNLAPASSGVHSTLGEIDQRLEDFNSAKRDFETAVKLDANNIEALIGLAAVQNKLGLAAGAKVTMQQAEALLKSTHAALPAAIQREFEEMRAR